VGYRHEVASTPDFDSFPIDQSIAAVDLQHAWIAVTWSDGRISRFHHIWLRDNCPCDACVHQVTKEQMFELVTVPADIHPLSATVGGDGSLAIEWAEDAHHSEMHAGWLRANAYDDDSRAERATAPITWDGSSFAVPPTFDGPAVLTDDDALLDWLTALSTYGVSRVRNLPTTETAIGDLVGRIGIVRETNFGLLWDVRSEPNPITNANTSLPLPPHVDLPTREYQPGLQFLHCLVNETEGGDNILLDGFRIAELLREESPEDYAVLTTVPWDWANRSRTSDYRWRSPLIVTHSDGSLKEVRVGNWLRSALDLPFDQVESAYRAYRRLFEMTYRADLELRFRLEPGDVMAFDNRRALHARSEFTDMSGRRHLRGAYSERDELHSRIRVLQRARRARRVADLAATSG
jgi:gamma-butyrobetaine dioxygenase